MFHVPESGGLRVSSLVFGLGRSIDEGMSGANSTLILRGESNICTEFSALSRGELKGWSPGLKRSV
jgi:hypothetical protein